MGLVDYSDSEGSASEAEAPVKAPVKATKPSQLSKKPFQKVVDRSNPGRIVVNLPQLSSSSDAKPHADEPPAKRAKTGGSGLFSGFNSFLPPPKNANKPKPASASASGPPRPGVNLKTSAAPGFSRSTGYDDDDAGAGGSGGMALPPPKAAQPMIPAEQKPEEEVKLVGKPLMFKPLSVSRNPKKKKPTAAAIAKAAAKTSQPTAPSATATATEMQAQAEPVPAPKVSLFSMHTEEPSEPTTKKNNDVYEPMFETHAEADQTPYDDYAQYASHSTTGPSATTAPGTESLDTVVDDLNLSAAQRRELFGRGGEAKYTANKVINFSMDREYRHNEEIRAAGEQELHNPIRSITGTGKNSLQKLVRNVQSQREALEDSFAKGRSNRKEASGKYGW